MAPALRPLLCLALAAGAGAARVVQHRAAAKAIAGDCAAAAQGAVQGPFSLIRDRGCACPAGTSLIGGGAACGDGTLRAFRAQDVAGGGCRCEKNLECKAVSTQQGFDLSTYISRPWYVQQQMPTQYLPVENNFCVSARYEKLDRPTLLGYTIHVFNQATNSAGVPSNNGTVLCAYGSDAQDPAKLAVAPCFIPRVLSGPYWVLAYNEAEGYALVSGGQPSLATPLGCRTGTGTNDAGLWIFTREAQPPAAVVEKVRGIAAGMGFDLSVLNPVSHANCASER